MRAELLFFPADVEVSPCKTCDSYLFISVQVFTQASVSTQADWTQETGGGLYVPPWKTSALSPPIRTKHKV